MRKKTKKQIILPAVIAISATIASVNATSLFSEDVSIPSICMNDIVATNDIVISNNPNDLKVYSFPSEDAEFEVGSIPYSWEIDRIGYFSDVWSAVSYNNEMRYVKASDITKEKDYSQINFYYDDVYSYSDNDTVKLYHDFNNLDNYIAIENGSYLYRLLSLDNGFSLVKYEENNYFVKTSEIAKKTYLGKFRITYYCACNICNGGYGAVDYFGNPLKDGTAAVDTSIIPFGTNFLIQENGFLRECVAKDIGGAIKGNHIDVFVDVPHSVCENLGNSYKDVYTFKKCE